MDTYSSAESSKPHSTHKAYVLNELKEAKQALALKDEAMKRLEERFAKVELKQERFSHSIHGRHNSPRHSSKDSSNAHGHGEDYRRRRHHHHSQGESHHREQRHHQEAKPQFPFLKVRSFSDGDQAQVDMEANHQEQEEVEAQMEDAHGGQSPPQRLIRSMFKALGANGRLFSLFVISLFEGA